MISLTEVEKLSFEEIGELLSFLKKEWGKINNRLGIIVKELVLVSRKEDRIRIKQGLNPESHAN